MVFVLVVHYKLQQEITKKEIWLFYYWFWINFSLQSFATCLSTVISRSLFCTIWQIESPLLSYKIPKFIRSKNIFRPGIISGNLPRSRVSLRHYLRSEEGGNLDKNENWICAMARYHAESNNISLTRNLPTDSRVRQWSYPLMIPLHYL